MKTQEKIRLFIERIKPFIQADGGDIGLMGCDEEKGIIEILLLGKFNHYSEGSGHVAANVESMLKRNIREVKEVRIARRALLRLLEKRISDTSYEHDVIAMDEYEVYSALFMQYLSGEANLPPLPTFSDNLTTLVIKELTVAEVLDGDKVTCLEMKSIVPFFNIKLDPTLIDDFNRKNKRSHRLEEKFSVPLNVVLISKQEIDEIFNKAGWEEFYRRYPDSGGYVTVSRVGFNKARTRAFHYVGSYSAEMVGDNYLFLLTKSEDE